MVAAKTWVTKNSVHEGKNENGKNVLKAMFRHALPMTNASTELVKISERYKFM